MLNDAKIKAAKPRERAYKLTDAEQLYLFVSPAGGRHWRMNYTYGAGAKGKPKQKTLSLGSYPAVSLLDARRKRDNAKDLLREGRDPAVERRISARAHAVASSNTFEAVARAWHSKQAPRWSAVHTRDVLDSLAENIFPRIGDLPITSIKAPILLELLTQVEDRGAIETAHRIRQRLSAVFVFGIAAGICDADPAASLGIALKPKPRSKKQPAVTDLEGVRKILKDAEAERCRAITKLALRFLALTAVRPGELRFGTWAEIEGIDFATGDASEPLWRIPSTRMKGREDRKAEDGGDHLVPLSSHAVEVLRVLHRLSGDLPIMFPGERHAHRPISENTIRALLIRAGYHQRHVPHGWRAAFSTIMNERAKAEGRDGDRAVIDLMLAHVPANKVESSYNRAAFMSRRREIAQEWGDLLVSGMPAPATHLGQPIRWAANGPGRT
jgi:integrase